MKNLVIKFLPIFGLSCVASFSFGQTDPGLSNAVFYSPSGQILDNAGGALSFTGVDYTVHTRNNGADLNPLLNYIGFFNLAGNPTTYGDYVGDTVKVTVPVGVNAGSIQTPFTFIGQIGAFEGNDPTFGLTIDFTADPTSKVTYLNFGGQPTPYQLKLEANAPLTVAGGQGPTAIYTDLSKQEPVVPEPSSMAAFGIAGLGILFFRRKRAQLISV